MFEKSDLSLNNYDHPKTESLCRIICQHEKVDPDREVTDIDFRIAKGVKYKLWEYNIPIVRKLLVFLSEV